MACQGRQVGLIDSLVSPLVLIVGIGHGNHSHVMSPMATRLATSFQGAHEFPCIRHMLHSLVGAQGLLMLFVVLGCHWWAAPS